MGSIRFSFWTFRLHADESCPLQPAKRGAESLRLHLPELDVVPQLGQPQQVLNVDFAVLDAGLPQCTVKPVFRAPIYRHAARCFSRDPSIGRFGCPRSSRCLAPTKLNRAPSISPFLTLPAGLLGSSGLSTPSMITPHCLSRRCLQQNGEGPYSPPITLLLSTMRRGIDPTPMREQGRSTTP